MKKTTQLGFYLIPPYNLAKEVLAMRNLSYDQYRVGAAQNFMIHMTIIGFFRLNDDTSYDMLVSTLDDQLRNVPAFHIFPERVVARDNGVGLYFPPERNPELYRLQSACFNAVGPHVAHDMRMPRTGNADKDFQAHVTVCMVDASPDLLSEMEAYFGDVEFSEDGYLARVLKLFEFNSDLWDAPESWIYNMKWRPLKTWQLQGNE